MSFFRYCRAVSTNNNRWLSSFSSSSSSGGIDPMMKIKRSGFPRIPWLFLSPTCQGRILPARDSPTCSGRILPVFDRSNRCYYDIRIPKVLQGRDNSVRGSGHGWLVMAKSKDYEKDDIGVPTEMTLSLYNPISRAHIPLPEVEQNVLGNCQVWGNPTKASPGQPLMSIVYGHSNSCLLIYRQGDDDWSTEIKTPPDDYIASTVYHEGDATLYVVYFDGRLSVFDLASSTLRPLINTPPPEIESLRGTAHIVGLVVGAAGDILLVMKNWTTADCPRYPGVFKFTRPQYFILFKLDKRCLKWVRTESISDHTLFMYRNDNQIISMVCDPSFTDAQANQIYIFNQHMPRVGGFHRGDYTDSINEIEISGNVKVCNLIPAAGALKNAEKKPAAGVPKGAEKERPPIFKTSKVLRASHLRYDYLCCAAWMVPSLS